MEATKKSWNVKAKALTVLKGTWTGVKYVLEVGAFAAVIAVPATAAAWLLWTVPFGATWLVGTAVGAGAVAGLDMAGRLYNLARVAIAGAKEKWANRKAEKATVIDMPEAAIAQA